MMTIQCNDQVHNVSNRNAFSVLDQLSQQNPDQEITLKDEGAPIMRVLNKMVVWDMYDCMEGM